MPEDAPVMRMVLPARRFDAPAAADAMVREVGIRVGEKLKRGLRLGLEQEDLKLEPRLGASMEEARVRISCPEEEVVVLKRAAGATDSGIARQMRGGGGGREEE